MKRAFTLIELLVVIAIIAILAAILFPVFAQAKQAAKGAASLSNNKQTTLAMIMYAGDYDDLFPIDETWGDRTAPLWFGTSGSEWTLWSMNILPYMKNVDILMDPLTSPETAPAGWPRTLWMSFNPQYGYNYTALSQAGPPYSSPIPRFIASTTSPANPADTVMLVGHPNQKEGANGWWYGPGTLTTWGHNDAPDCYTIPSLCFENWGANSFWYNNWFKVDEAGHATGLNTFRKAKQMVMSFTDGHAASMAPGRAAVGTNFAFNRNASQTVVTDRTKYIWDLQ